MNKDIKEIIEQMKIAIKFKKSPLGIDYSISIYDMEQLLDYITDLQECYCNRTDCSGRIKDSKKYNSLQQRIDKAIEYIEDNMEINKECPKELLDILRGKDNE